MLSLSSESLKSQPRKQSTLPQSEQRARNSSFRPQKKSNQIPRVKIPILKKKETLFFFLSLPHAPFSRATPYPEVTVLFCRLPLLTLCPKLEAFHLWNLLRIFVRLGWKIILSLWFSRWIERDGKLMFKSNFNFRGLPVDLTTIVINNTLGVVFFFS